MKDLGKILVWLPVLVLAIGLIGWVLTLRNDVTASVEQTEGLHQALDEIHERFEVEIDGLQLKITELEEMLAIADNEMRTIMADHSGFNDVLQQLGQSGLLPSGERRTYGGYGN